MNEGLLDRRLFLKGFMLTSAGLAVPLPIRVFMPPAPKVIVYDALQVEVFMGPVSPDQERQRILPMRWTVRWAQA